MCCEHLLAHRSITGVAPDSPSEHLDVAPQPAAVRAARRFVTERVDHDAREAAALLTSEVVTNGVLHARTGLTLGVTTGSTHTLVTVADGDSAHPVPRPPDPNRPSGRGIVLVESLAAEWGVLTHDTGKTVWFTLPRRSGDLPEPEGEGQGA